MSQFLERIHHHLQARPLAEYLTTLFCQTLNWGAPRGMAARPLQVGAPVNRTLTAHPRAQLSGLSVYLVGWLDDRPPGVIARRAVQRALKPIHTATIELRTLPYDVGTPARPTIERVGELALRSVYGCAACA